MREDLGQEGDGKERQGGEWEGKTGRSQTLQGCVSLRATRGQKGLKTQLCKSFAFKNWSPGCHLANEEKAEEARTPVSCWCGALEGVGGGLAGAQALGWRTGNGRTDTTGRVGCQVP